jgi:hypothetical protein
MAGEGPEDPDAGDVDDAEDGEEVSLDGVQIGPPGAEATALLGWLSSAASAGDLGALAATLQARPIAGLERVGDLQSVLSSMAVVSGQTHGAGVGFPTPGAASPSNSQGGIDFGGLRLWFFETTPSKKVSFGKKYARREETKDGEGTVATPTRKRIETRQNLSEPFPRSV